MKRQSVSNPSAQESNSRSKYAHRIFKPGYCCACSLTGTCTNSTCECIKASRQCYRCCPGNKCKNRPQIANHSETTNILKIHPRSQKQSTSQQIMQTTQQPTQDNHVDARMIISKIPKNILKSVQNAQEATQALNLL